MPTKISLLEIATGKKLVVSVSLNTGVDMIFYMPIVVIAKRLDNEFITYSLDEKDRAFIQLDTEENKLTVHMNDVSHVIELAFTSSIIEFMDDLILQLSSPPGGESNNPTLDTCTLSRKIPRH